jgi:hypothetical protein
MPLTPTESFIAFMVRVFILLIRSLTIKIL